MRLTRHFSTPAMSCCHPFWSRSSLLEPAALLGLGKPGLDLGADLDPDVLYGRITGTPAFEEHYIHLAG